MAANSCVACGKSSLFNISLGVRANDFPFCTQLVSLGSTRSFSPAASWCASILGLFSACFSISNCEYRRAFCSFLCNPSPVGGIFYGCAAGVCCCSCCVGSSWSFSGCDVVSWVCSWVWVGSSSFCRSCYDYRLSVGIGSGSCHSSRAISFRARDVACRIGYPSSLGVLLWPFVLGVGYNTVSHLSNIVFIGLPLCKPNSFSLRASLVKYPQSNFSPSYVELIKPTLCLGIP